VCDFSNAAIYRNSETTYQFPLNWAEKNGLSIVQSEEKKEFFLTSIFQNINKNQVILKVTVLAEVERGRNSGLPRRLSETPNGSGTSLFGINFAHWQMNDT
jgi:hypothetical protein